VSAYGKKNKFYIGDFDDELPEIFPKVIRATYDQAEVENGFIEFYINSYGGNGHDVMTLVELMEIAKSHGIIVRTIVTHAAYSAGSVAAVAGSEGERFMARNGSHLIHYGYSWTYATGPVEAARDAKQQQKWFKNLTDHYAKYTKLSVEELKKNMNNDNWWLDFNRCKRYGVCDKPTDQFYLARS
jgi:ATP-dependent protease ClpP protease subunit